MNLFKRKTETAITPIVDAPITVAVPDIKDYLVKEYERVNELKLYTEKLEEDLELSRETKLKYEATLVTLDEYSKRLKNAENEIAKERQKAAQARREADNYRDQVNSYKIQFAEAALTKDQIKDEIIEEFKAAVFENINNTKGNLSKALVCAIISETVLNKTDAECVDEVKR